MTTCSVCFDRQGVIVTTADGPRLARCPACGGTAISARAAEPVRGDRQGGPGRRSTERTALACAQQLRERPRS